MIGGDFKNIVNSSEKLGGRPLHLNRFSKLWNYINNCKLIDLGFKVCKFTWSNHRRKSKGLIMERLDCVSANEDWMQIFPNTTITHLPKIYSDHSPILVKLNNFQ